MKYFEKYDKRKDLPRYTIIIQGFYKIIDGLIDIISLGFYKGGFALNYLFYLRNKYLKHL